MNRFRSLFHYVAMGCTAVVIATALHAQTRTADAHILKGLHTKAATLQDLTLPQTSVAKFDVAVELGGRDYELRLAAHDVRAPDYQLLVSDAKGVRKVSKPPNTTYRGTVADHAGSVVAASLFEGQLTAYIVMDPDQPAWNVQPVTLVDKTAARRTHAVHFGRDGIAPAGTCGMTTKVAPVDRTPLLPATQDRPFVVCEIANDADYEFYPSNGSNVAATAANVAGIINGCQVIYQRDTCIEYSITATIVRRARVYTTSNYSQLLTQYRNRWVSSHASVRRDISHLFTGKARTSGVIGVAYLDTICNASTGYGLSFTNYTSNQTFRIGLTAHELGHSWGAGHCDSTSSCFIMCSVINGCGNDVTKFGTSSVASIGSTRDTSTCLHKNPFRLIGGAIQGVKGEPQLLGEGIVGSTTTPPKITLSGYRNNSPGVFVVGLTPTNLPYLGGTLIPQTDFAIGIMGNGSDIVLDASAMNTSPLTNLWVQAFYLDSAALQGVSATAGYRIFIR